MILILSVFIGLLMVWMYRLGKKSNELDHAKTTLENIGNINEFERKEDIEADRQVGSAGDNPVGAPWLRDNKR